MNEDGQVVDRQRRSLDVKGRGQHTLPVQAGECLARAVRESLGPRDFRHVLVIGRIGMRGREGGFEIPRRSGRRGARVQGHLGDVDCKNRCWANGRHRLRAYDSDASRLWVLGRS